MSRVFQALQRRPPRGSPPRPSLAPRARQPPTDNGARVRRLLGPGRLLQRTPDEPDAAAAGRAQVGQATRSLVDKAAELGAEGATVTANKFELEIDTWYRAVVGAEATIDSALAGDAALREALRKAYVGTVRVLVAKRAADSGESEAALYEKNSGRIPMWAWPVAHHLEANISTPIAEGRTANAAGEVDFSSNGYAVTIAPDGVDATIKSSAATRLGVTWCKASLTYESNEADAKILSIDRRGPMCARIQTLYKPPATAAGRSGYGRGTTPEDIAGGRVSPRSTSLGLHEGEHGLDLVDYLSKNKPPKFPGKVGMTRTQLTSKAKAQYKALQDAALAASAASHCEGRTIDEHARENGVPGHQIECSTPEAEEATEVPASSP